MSASCRCLAVALVALGLSACLPAAAEPFEFVVLGDIPYNDSQAKSLGGYLGGQIRGSGTPFVIHYGDIKAGDGACSDSVLRETQQLLQGLAPGGLFYTPGDNDWTDCDRASTGDPMDELERLAYIRTLFFGQDLPSNPAWAAAWQTPELPENARWRDGGLVFATLHIVGTDNGRSEILMSNPSTALDAVDARDAANLEWLDLAFDAAQEDGIEGLVVAMQADPFDLWHPDARGIVCSAEERVVCNPYLTFLERLTEGSAALGKPVLLVHGSTNQYCIERGFGGWRAPNLWRLNGPGDFVVVDAAVVRFDPSDRRAPFSVRLLLAGDPPIDCAPWAG